MNRRLWLDCDGVLLDWVTPFLQHSGLAAKGLRYEDIFNYDFSLLFTNREDFVSAMHRFHASELYQRLPRLVEREDLQALKDAGFELHVITAVENNPVARNARVSNLFDYFNGVLETVNFVEHGQCKLEAIQQKFPGDKIVIVEDQPSLLKKASEWAKCDLIDHGKTDVLAYGIIHPYNEAALEFCHYIIKSPTTKDAFKRIIRSKDIV